MTDDDRRTFARGLAALGEAFGEAISDLRAEAYFDALRDLETDTVLSAMRAAIRDNRFFPRPVELRELITGNPQDRAELAWSGLLALIRRVGWCGNPEGQWPDEAAKRAALDLFGGWVPLCEHLPGGGPELIGWAKRFTAAYVAYAHRDGLQPALPPVSRAEAKQILDTVTRALDEQPREGRSMPRPVMQTPVSRGPLTELDRLRADLVANRKALAKCSPTLEPDL